MQFSIDLRYVPPPLINVIFFLFLASQGDGKPWDLIVGALKVDQHPSLKLMLFILAIFFLLLFLFISIKLPLLANPVHFGVGDFSRALALSLIAAIILPPPLFWLTFPILILTSINPSSIITYTPQHHEIPQPTRMHFSIDLRYVLTPLLNAIFFLFLASQGGGKPWDLIVGALKVDQQPILKLMLFILAIFFLFISIKLPLTANPVHFRVGDFSSALALSLIASIILPPPQFWLTFPILKLTSIYPSPIITYTPQHHEIPQPAPPQVDANLEQDLVILIDE